MSSAHKFHKPFLKGAHTVHPGSPSPTIVFNDGTGAKTPAHRVPKADHATSKKKTAHAVSGGDD